MTATPTDWCFDLVDISWAFAPAPAPAPGPDDANSNNTTLTAARALELIFGELRHEADRPIRDRINAALRHGRRPAPS